MAATAPNIQGANLGAHIMLAGIVFQLAVIIVYAFCGIEYYFSYSRNSLINSHFDKETNSDTTAQVRGTYTENLKRMAYALVFTTICLFIRAIYRTIELSNGWDGRIISTQRYFNVLDGAMVVLAIYTFNLAHPGRLFAVPSVCTKFSSA